MKERSKWIAALAILGTMLALCVFMADALRVANDGVEAMRMILPTRFAWQLFGVALALMATPIVDLGLQIRSRQQPPKNLVR